MRGIGEVLKRARPKNSCNQTAEGRLHRAEGLLYKLLSQEQYSDVVSIFIGFAVCCVSFVLQKSRRVSKRVERDR
jgi:hypothetical protein